VHSSITNTSTCKCEHKKPARTHDDIAYTCCILHSKAPLVLRRSLCPSASSSSPRAMPDYDNRIPKQVTKSLLRCDSGHGKTKTQRHHDIACASINMRVPSARCPCPCFQSRSPKSPGLPEYGHNNMRSHDDTCEAESTRSPGRLHIQKQP
jgi:hypothetical protein